MYSELADVDGDGDDDLVAGSGQGFLFLLVNATGRDFVPFF